MALVRPILIKTDSQVTTIKRWEESVAVGFVDGSVKILDIETHKWKSEFEAHGFGVNEIIWDLYGKYIFSCADDGTTQIRDANGVLMTSLCGHTNYVQTLAIDPRNLLLISAGSDCSALLWDIRNLCEINNFYHIHRETITSVDFSKDSSVFLTASYDGTMHLWDTVSLNSIKTISHSKNSPISKAKFIGDRGHITSACLTSNIYLWDIEEIKSLPLRTYKGHSNERYKCHMLVDENDWSIWNGSENGYVHNWDLKSQASKFSIKLAEENSKIHVGIIHTFDLKNDLIIYSSFTKGEIKTPGSLVISKYELEI